MGDLGQQSKSSQTQYPKRQVESDDRNGEGLFLEENNSFLAKNYFGPAIGRPATLQDMDSEDTSSLSSASTTLRKGKHFDSSDKHSSSIQGKKLNNPVTISEDSRAFLSSLSPETQSIISSVRSSSSTINEHRKKPNVSRSMVDEILREARLKAATRALESGSSNSSRKSDVQRSKGGESHKNDETEINHIHRSMDSKKYSITTADEYDHVVESRQGNNAYEEARLESRQDSGFTADDWIDEQARLKKDDKSQQIETAKNSEDTTKNRPPSRMSLPTRLASLIGIHTGDSSSTKAENNRDMNGTSGSTVYNETFSSESKELNHNSAAASSLDEKTTSKGIVSNEADNSKKVPDISIDTNIGKPRKEQRYVVRSPASPRYTKKRTVIRRANVRIHPKNPSDTSDDYQRNSKSPLKTVEISNELDEISAQFQDALGEFSKRYQDSTVALAEKSHLLKKNQELWHILAAKEEEIDCLKNELWEAGNKIQDYEADLKDIIIQQQEPLALNQEDLIRIEREIEDQEVLISGYQKENDKLMNELKSMNEKLRSADREQEEQHSNISELHKENEKLKELLHEKESQESLPEGAAQQIEDMKKEIERLREKEKSHDFKDIALKEMEELKKELSVLRDRDSEYMIKVDDLEHQLSKARDEVEEITRSKTESLENLTEEMNMMKFTYESQIEKVKKDATSKEAKEQRFRKLQSALEKIEDLINTSEVTKICTDLRRTNILPPKKRRKSTSEVSKDTYGYGSTETRSPRSPTTKTLRRSPSRSSMSKSRASSISRTVSPTPSMQSSVSAFSSKTDLHDDSLFDSEEVIELREKVMKLEEESNSSRELAEKLEDELKLAKEIKTRLEETIDSLKKEHAEYKEQHDRKMHEMEELVMLIQSDTLETNEEEKVTTPNPPPVVTDPNLLKELNNKQSIIEELVAKLKRKEEQLEYYQNAYLEKTEEFEQLIERTQAQAQGVAGASPPPASVSNDDSIPNNSNALKYLNDALPGDELGDLSSLPITSDIMGLFGGLGDDGEFSVIEKLIAQLERTIVERTMQRDAAHQRATDAESKLLAISREKMSWGSGYDTTVKQLKTQVQQLQELLQLERKAARKTNNSATLSEKESTMENDESKLVSNEPKPPTSTEQKPSNPPSDDQSSSSDLRKLRSQIESLTAENITLRTQLKTSEAVRQAVHENTLTILQQNNKYNLATDEDESGLRKLAMEKDAEVSVWKGRCAGLEHVVERQRELLAHVVPTVKKGQINEKHTGKLFDDDAIDIKEFAGLNENAKQIIQKLHEENVLMRQALSICCQQSNGKIDDAPPKYTPLEPNAKSTPTAVQLEALGLQISEMEARFLKREKELQEVIADTKRQGELQLERWRAKWGAIIDKKNSEIKGFRNELEALMKCLGNLDIGNGGGISNGIIPNSITKNIS
ncbi:13641_t:CDS:1 [Acaulospora morrowiae]|uniref:13641_t:CDS:1 n=1 Tax=Acaulospora morrowiae TaxID=94023 RepID=A0A9N9C421_9GLOM|nr:13641_t:CDS:1 [Acaulospora morrowiae]